MGGLVRSALLLQVPGLVNPGRLHLALIPLFDMVNAEPGEVTAFFNMDDNCLVLEALHDFAAGAEVTMSYGHRDSGALLQFQGFVLPNNTDDYTLVDVALPSPAADPIHKIKTNLLASMGHLPQRHAGQYIFGGPPGAPIMPEDKRWTLPFALQVAADGTATHDLMTFCRIACLNRTDAVSAMRVHSLVKQAREAAAAKRKAAAAAGGHGHSHGGVPCHGHGHAHGEAPTAARAAADSGAVSSQAAAIRGHDEASCTDTGHDHSHEHGHSHGGGGDGHGHGHSHAGHGHNDGDDEPDEDSDAGLDLSYLPQVSTENDLAAMTLLLAALERQAATLAGAGAPAAAASAAAAAGQNATNGGAQAGDVDFVNVFRESQHAILLKAIDVARRQRAALQDALTASAQPTKG